MYSCQTFLYLKNSFVYYLATSVTLRIGNEVIGNVAFPSNINNTIFPLPLSLV